ncbi:MAG TPA: ABC transporter ATP-binding protein [Candidatus Limnocylindrales bacterium]|nr:ABC transporter ATP-binding protein [Candidatus Limnocylindrales bacterium]
MQPLVVTRGLRFRYEDGTLALNGVDFTLQPGETVALFGPNGSGKTTFILHLNGLLMGDGHVEVCGLPVTPHNFATIRNKVGIVFQESDSQLFMPSVLEDVAFGLLNRGMPADKAAECARAALDRVGIASLAPRPPYHLSAGEKKRAAIAGILALDPDLLILDEPTTFLDPPGQRALAQLLGSLPQAKILVTHDIPFAEAMCTRAIFFSAGAIVAEGPVAELVERFDWKFTPRR